MALTQEQSVHYGRNIAAFGEEGQENYYEERSSSSGQEVSVHLFPII